MGPMTRMDILSLAKGDDTIAPCSQTKVAGEWQAKHSPATLCCSPMGTRLVVVVYPKGGLNPVPVGRACCGNERS